MSRAGKVSVPLIFLIVVLAALAGLLGYQLIAGDAGAEPMPPIAPKTEAQAAPKEAERSTPAPINTDGDRVDTADANPDRTARPPLPTRPLTGEAREIAGIVHDQDRRPLPGATVILFRYDHIRNENIRLVEQFRERPQGQVITGSDGSYVFKDLAPGELWYVRATANNYIAQIKDNVKVGALADFHLQPGSRVLGKVIDVVTKEPIENALVKGWYSVGSSGNHHVSFRWEEKVYTKADGSFEISGAPQSTVKWLLYHQNYEDKTEDRAIVAGMTNELTFTMDRGIDVRGVVMNKLTDQPLARVRVQTSTALLPEKTVYTDENGQFSIPGLKRGTQAFSMSRDGFTQSREIYEVSPSDRFEEAAQNFLQFRMDPAGRASGVVLSSSGAPVANVKIFVVRVLPILNAVRSRPDVPPGTPEMVTGADGRFLVGDIGTDSEHRVVAMHDSLGYGVSQTIQPGPDETIEGLSVRLTDGGQIEGVVLNEDGVPVVEAEVLVEIPPFREAFFGPASELGRGGPRLIQTGADGSFRLDRLWAGTFKFRISHPGHVLLEDQQVVLQENDERVMREFRMRVSRSISGFCAIQGEGSLDQVEVVIKRPFSEEAVVTARCDEKGYFQADGLIKGNYTLQARLPGYSSAVVENIAADSSNVNLTLVKNGGIVGLVASSTGEPVEEFSIVVAPYFGEDVEQVIRAEREALPPKFFREQGGIFNYDDLSPGRYVMTVRARGFAAVTKLDINVPSGIPADVGRIEVSRGGRIVGLLVSSSNEGITNATVVVDSLSMTGAAGVAGEKLRSVAKGGGENGEDGGGGVFGTASWQSGVSPSGEWSITGLPDGLYRVSVRCETHVVPAEEQIDIRNGMEVRREWMLPRAAVAIFTIVDDLGAPVPAVVAAVTRTDTGERVRISGSAGGRSDVQGRLELNGLAPGTFKVTLNRSGYLVTEATITVREGERIERRETLEKILR